MLTDPQKLVAAYELGILNLGDALGALTEAAVERGPEELASSLSPEYLDRLREYVLKLAAMPRDQRVTIWAGSIVPGPAFDSWRREQERRFEAGLCRWHAFFIPQEGPGGEAC